MEREYGVAAKMGRLRVAYKETITREVAAEQGRFVHRTGGHGQYGHVILSLHPGARGSGMRFENAITGGAVPRQFIPAVEQGGAMPPKPERWQAIPSPTSRCVSKAVPAIPSIRANSRTTPRPSRHAARRSVSLPLLSERCRAFQWALAVDDGFCFINGSIQRPVFVTVALFFKALNRNLRGGLSIGVVRDKHEAAEPEYLQIRTADALFRERLN